MFQPSPGPDAGCYGPYWAKVGQVTPINSCFILSVGQSVNQQSINLKKIPITLSILGELPAARMIAQGSHYTTIG